MIVRFANEEYITEQAIKGNDYILLKNATLDGEAVGDVKFGGVNDFSAFTIEGGQWSRPTPTEIEKTNANVDYIAMMCDVELPTEVI